jgi:hypothetical protein
MYPSVCHLQTKHNRKEGTKRNTQANENKNVSQSEGVMHTMKE